MSIMKRLPKLVAGVDISKYTLDIALVSDANQTLSFKINNAELDILTFLKQVRSQFKLRYSDMVFCAENMGLYAKFLVDALCKRRVTLFLESPLQIKRSLGLQRGKTDKADAIRIAQYARKNFYTLNAWEPPRPCISEMKDLHTIRKRLLKVKVILKGNSKNENHYLGLETASSRAALSLRSLAAVTEELLEIENRVLSIIETDEKLKHLFNLVTSVPGIGKVIGTQLIVHTNEFRDFRDPRKFASFCGIAPFPWSSGISVSGKTRVSFYANRELKSLLHIAAMRNVKHKSSSLGVYYRRKVKEGKNKMSVLNAIRNKLIHRIFSCVNNDKPFQEYQVLGGLSENC